VSLRTIAEYFLNNCPILPLGHGNKIPIQQSKSRFNTYTAVSLGAITYNLAGENMAGGRMKQKIDYFDLVTKAVMWILGIIAIYMLILKITGHSPTIDTILMTVIGILAVGLLNLYYHFGEINNFINRTFPRFENNIKESFEKAKDDSKELKEEFKKFREDLTNVKRKK